MNFCFFFFFLLNLSIEAKKNIQLFISFDCFYCMEALQIAKSNKQKANFEIYYFCKNAEEEEKMLLILAAEDDLDLIYELFLVFLMNGKNYYKVFKKKYSKLILLCANNKKNYKKRQKEHKKMFIKRKIEGTPSWFIDNKLIEGIEDKIELKFI